MIILRYSVEKQLILYAYVLIIQVNTKVYLGLHIMPYSIIKEVKVRLWSKYDVHFVANNVVNILAGINGSGKTSLLPETNKLALVNINGKNLVVLIPSVDKIVIRDKRKASNALAQDLELYIFDMKTGPSTMSYRMSMNDASADKQAYNVHSGFVKITSAK